MFSRKKKGQSTAEYVIVLGLIVGAVIAMQVYVKRGLQSRLKEATDFVVNPEPNMQIFDGSEQFEPDYHYSSLTRRSESEEKSNLFTENDQEGAGAFKKELLKEEMQVRGTQEVRIGGAKND